MGFQQARQRGRRSLVAAAVAVFVVLVAGEVSSSCGGLKVSVNKINLSLPSIRADLSPSILHFRWDSLSTIPVSAFMVMNPGAGVANQAICAAALSFFTGPVSIQDPSPSSSPLTSKQQLLLVLLVLRVLDIRCINAPRVHRWPPRGFIEPTFHPSVLLFNLIYLAEDARRLRSR